MTGVKHDGQQQQKGLLELIVLEVLYRAHFLKTVV